MTARVMGLRDILVMQEENGGAGVYSMDSRKLYMLQNPDWKQDIIPEIFNGHNIADFVDVEIEEKLKELDFEEDEMAEEWLRQVRQISSGCLACKCRAFQASICFLSRDEEAEGWLRQVRHIPSRCLARGCRAFRASICFSTS
jgi:hypothetical protein